MGAPVHRSVKRQKTVRMGERMKLTAEQIVSGEDEIIVKYREMTPELSVLIHLLKQGMPVVTGREEGRQYRIAPGEIYYFESVDERTFAYTREHTLQVAMTLAEAEERLEKYGFFRCNKSMVLNLNRIDSVKNELGSRINAALDNGEHVIISRHYARRFRELLRGGEEDA